MLALSFIDSGLIKQSADSKHLIPRARQTSLLILIKFIITQLEEQDYLFNDSDSYHAINTTKNIIYIIGHCPI
jgi:hypothetical protein